MIIVGFDPGRDKCGLAVANNDNQILYNQVVNSEDAIDTIRELISKYKPNKLVMGNQTTSKHWKQKILDNINLSIDLILVDERNSTLEARRKYWEIYPPKGLNKLIPLSLRVPPRAVDDIVAIILIERYFKLEVRHC